MKRNELVKVTRVYSINFISDFFQKIKNIIGGRLKSYERMVDECIDDTWKEFNKLYPKADNIKVDLENFIEGSIMVIITGMIRK